MVYKYVSLSDIGKISTGNTPSKKNPEFYDSANIMFVKPNDFETNKISNMKFSTEFLSYKGSVIGRKVKKGTVLVTCIGIIGKVCIASEALCFNQQINAIEVDESIIDNIFLAYSIIHRKKQLEAIANAPVVPIINKTQFSNFQIPLPPLPIQKKIVRVLDKAQELIDLREKQIKLLDDLVQSVFYDMFGDPVTNPKGWEKTALKNVIKQKPQNGFFVKNDIYIPDGNVGVIWISDFINKFYAETKKLRRVNPSDEDIIKYKVNYGDILFCRSSLNVEGIGKAACVPKTKDILFFECHIIKISLEKCMIPEFFKVLSDTQFFRNQIMKNSKTATMTTISQEGIINTEIILPPVSEQMNFLNKLTLIFKEKKLMQQSLEEMKNNYNSLMQRAFRGDLFKEDASA